MPTKNRQDLIGESIKSIINQTEKDWELIIVDDHSDEGDKTEEVVKSFADDRVKYFKLKDENGLGIAAARNFGNQMASSDIIAVMDSDDLAYPERAEVTLAEFNKGGIDIVYAKIHMWYPETNKIENRPENFEARDFNLEDFKLHDFIPHSTSAYKRKIALEFPYNSFFRMAEDYDMFSRMYVHKYNFSFINKHLVKYRVHDDQVMHKAGFSFKYALMVVENRGWNAEEK
jgi:glycosyltransferase involved in cell wall biosynthesis